MQYTDEKPAEQIKLYVYKGADGQFTLYEDEGTNYQYEQGNYAMIPFEYKEADGTLTIGDRQGHFTGMLKERTFHIVVVSKKKAQPFDLNVNGVVVKYTGNKQVIQL